MDIYDANTDTWTSTFSGAGALSEWRIYGASAAAGNLVAFAGGRCVGLVRPLE